MVSVGVGVGVGVVVAWLACVGLCGASDVPCGQRSNAELVLDTSTGQRTCVCVANHVCSLVGPSGAKAYCGAGTINIGDAHQPRDRIPSQCPQCQCEKVDPSVFAEASAPRMIVASVPRSGNSWVRQLLELASGVATETVLPEAYQAPPSGAGENEEIQAVSSNGSKLFGYSCGRINYCDRVSLPKPGALRIVKTHATFLSSRKDERGLLASDAGVGAFLLPPIRNPLDNYEAWKRYHNGFKKKTYPGDNLSEFLDT